jgi:hypothetical protein
MQSVNTATTYATIGAFENAGNAYGDSCIICLLERYSGG